MALKMEAFVSFFDQRSGKPKSPTFIKDICHVHIVVGCPNPEFGH